MSLKAFNLAILIGLLLVLVGGCLIALGPGLAFTGLLIIGLTIYIARLAGIYNAPAEAEKGDD